MRFLGLDLGSKRTGVALSDPEGTLAFALSVIETKKPARYPDFGTILKLARKHEVGCIVIGLPLSLDGDVGKEARKVEDFSKKLSERIEIPVKMWDERLTTFTAEQVLLRAGTKREQREKHRDAVAAAIILQNYLDWRKCQSLQHKTWGKRIVSAKK